MMEKRTCLGDYWACTAERFKAVGMAEPSEEAGRLLAGLLGCSLLDLYLKRPEPFPEDLSPRWETAVAQRAQGQPLQYILGETYFCGLRLKSDSRALIPRPETEGLVELVGAFFQDPGRFVRVLDWISRGEGAVGDVALAWAESRERLQAWSLRPSALGDLREPERGGQGDPDSMALSRKQPPEAGLGGGGGLPADPPGLSFLDLGTGSGAIALALAAAFPQAQVCGTDLSVDALALAQENAQQLGQGASGRLHWVHSDWFQGLPPGRHYHAVVANPPYLTQPEWESAQPEVRRYEPYRALVAAQDGLQDLRHLLELAPSYLLPGGLLAMETGISHAQPLWQAAQAAGIWQWALPAVDLSGRWRYFLACKNEN